MIRFAALALSVAWAPLTLLAAQHAPTAQLSGQGIFIYTHVDPIPGGGTLGETRLVQPIVMLDVAALERRLLLHVSADFEGWTLANGELAPGVWGEGYVDRRHPHTYLHELMLTWPDAFGRIELVVAGAAGPDVFGHARSIRIAGGCGHWNPRPIRFLVSPGILLSCAHSHPDRFLRRARS